VNPRFEKKERRKSLTKEIKEDSSMILEKVEVLRLHDATS
jgi:hypothetical protein